MRTSKKQTGTRSILLYNQGFLKITLVSSLLFSVPWTLNGWVGRGVRREKNTVDHTRLFHGDRRWYL